MCRCASDLCVCDFVCDYVIVDVVVYYVFVCDRLILDVLCKIVLFSVAII